MQWVLSLLHCHSSEEDILCNYLQFSVHFGHEYVTFILIEVYSNMPSVCRFSVDIF
jgi:hypothetical protein